MRKIGVLCLAVLMGGCLKAEIKPEAGAPAAPEVRQAKAKSASGGREMIGRNRDELVQRFGQPQQIMDVTLVGRPASEGWVYTGGSCFDTYVVLEQTGEVIDYFCR
ncbi:MAG: hypothetical protein HQL56_07640 [Magnetococcales bacterium]|nr:hypothetical protein [Magnetococcales bacterium]